MELLSILPLYPMRILSPVYKDLLISKKLSIVQLSMHTNSRHHPVILNISWLACFFIPNTGSCLPMESYSFRTSWSRKDM
ncbi:hypothetical protein BDV28DRAFT_133584 [Aspergillus coremiiformis]|uniref:Uncharacterized protein n=1 Tax=Aspergillus coremiiformis TaxID=138285 RepID=A0A5N6Z7R9_9EURO|nr:hypothetical protein BDV28DRAFT_133584 [Aspergillus coremiiformis]